MARVIMEKVMENQNDHPIECPENLTRETALIPVLYVFVIVRYFSQEHY